MRKNMESGQSLFEVVVALAISTVIIIALVSLVSSSIRNTTFSKNKTLAARYAQEATEWLRGQRDEDIDTFMTNTTSQTWCLKNLAWDQVGICATTDVINDTPFVRQVEFSDCTSCTSTVVQADIIVSWNDSQGNHEVRSATNFSDWRER